VPEHRHQESVDAPAGRQQAGDDEKPAQVRVDRKERRAKPGAVDHQAG
jgi:hypothetical protein